MGNLYLDIALLIDDVHDACPAQMMMVVMMMMLGMGVRVQMMLMLRPRRADWCFGYGGTDGGAAMVIAAASPRHQHHQLLEDRLVGVGACAGSIHNRVLRRAVLLAGHAAHEDLLEGLAELSRHAAVDAKVDGVAQHQKEVRQHDEDVGNAVVQKLNDQRAHNVHDRDHGNGYFGNEEHRHHHDQHQCGAVGVAQLLALLLAILAEQQLATLLRLSQRGKEQNVQSDQNDAGQQIDEQHAEQEVAGVVDVHADVVVHPLRGLQVADLRLVAVPLDLDGYVGSVEEARQLVQEGQQRDVAGAATHTRHCAPGACHGGVADVDVSAKGQRGNVASVFKGKLQLE